MAFKTTNWGAFEKRDNGSKANKVLHKDSRAYVIQGKAGDELHKSTLSQVERIRANMANNS